MTTIMKKWIDENKDYLTEAYEESIDMMQDSGEHKKLMQNSDKCLYEWCEDNYYMLKAHLEEI
jgi:hypothetical protein